MTPESLRFWSDPFILQSDGACCENRTGHCRKNWLATGRLAELHETGGLFDVEFIDEEPVLIGQPGPGISYFQSNSSQLIIPDDLPETGWYNREKEPREHYPVMLGRSSTAY